VRKKTIRKREKYEDMLKFEDCFYLEGPKNREEIYGEMKNMEVGERWIGVRSSPMNSWHLVYLQGDVSNIKKKLLEKAAQRNWKVIDGTEFLKLEKEY
jgi:hypothetical protein